MNPTNPTNPMNPIAVECVGVVGLGYVGLSLAFAFARVIPTIGFDIDHDRIRELRGGHDSTGEMVPGAFNVPYLTLTNDPGPLRQSDFVIVTVPTPVDRAKHPDLSHLIDASRLIGRILKSRRPTTKPNEPNKPIIVYESTVYPGCTEEVCIPVLEQESGLKAGSNFKVGYSPERINPGDPEHTLETVVKVVAAQNEETTEAMAKVYGLVVKGGICQAPDIRTAEAAKVIENIQRDLNIALMNELAMLFHRLGIDSREVLRVAQTKWNFLPFKPGLVGGHCIPVDPYYLTYKAQEVGYHPEVILAGRRINDSMGVYIAQETIKLLIKAGKAVRGAKILILGATFKEDVRDVRNTRVVDLVRELETYGTEVWVHDPYVEPTELKKLGLSAVSDPFQRHQLNKLNEPNNPHESDQSNQSQHDAVVLAVPHRMFREREPEVYFALLKDGDAPGVLVDVKGVLGLDQEIETRNPGIIYWTL